MKGKKVLLILTSLCWLGGGLYFSRLLLGAYGEGGLRRAGDPFAPVYTPEGMGEILFKLLPVLVPAAALTLLCLALGIREKARPSRNRYWERETLKHLLRGEEAGLEEKALEEKGRRYGIAGAAGLLLCLVPVLFYLLQPGHYRSEAVEADFRSLLVVLLPCLAAGLAVCFFFAWKRERCLEKEADLLRARVKQKQKQDQARKKADGMAAEGEGEERKGPGKTEEKKEPVFPRRRAAAAVLLLMGIGFLLAGIRNGSVMDVLQKAKVICTECIGLG